MSETPHHSPKAWDDRLAERVWFGRPAGSLAERTRRRVWVRLVPLLLVLYVIAYIDRANISIAKFGMARSAGEQGLAFDDDVIAYGMGIFFWGYWILEIPSTLSVERRGARRVFVRILVLWGLCATLLGFLDMPLLGKVFGWLPKLPEGSGQSSLSRFAHHWNGLGTDAESQFYALRFLLGFFEGGFFPTVVMYLSIWFPKEYRAKAMAAFMAAMPLSNVIGAPLSQAIANHIHWAGLAGWRWTFILEGVAPIAAAAVVWFVLPDRPQTAPWLRDDEREWLVGELDREHQTRTHRERGNLAGHLGVVAALTAVYFMQAGAMYGIVFFAPTIIKALSGASETAAAWGAALLFTLAFFGMQWNGARSDARQERVLHAAAPLAFLGCSLLAVALLRETPTLGLVVFLALTGTSMFMHIPAFWSIPSTFLGSTAAASAIGFINMIGNLGGAYSPRIIGKAASQGDFAPGLMRVALMPLVGAALLVAVAWIRKRHAGKNADIEG